MLGGLYYFNSLRSYIMRIFVSYTTKDPVVTKEALARVEERISPFANVFIDLLHNKKGNQCRVNFELKRSDIVLQIASPKFKSEWVQKELLAARKRGKPILKVDLKELIEMDDETIQRMLYDVDKKGWSVWTILLISLIACIGVSVLGIWLSYLYVSYNFGASSNNIQEARGLFGDSWGGVNAIVSALAFAGVIVTLFLQNRDLNLQRKEMARQREEFEKENHTLKYQRFENLFYNMLHLQQEIVASLRYDYYEEERRYVTDQTVDSQRIKRTVSGRDVFRYTFEFAEIELLGKNNIRQDLIHGYRSFLYKKGLDKYDSTWIPTYYDHYFRHLYKIIQFVDLQGFSFDESYKYVSLLRGTLSRYELVWIYYNALNPLFSKLKKLIEKYSLLKNIRPELLTRCFEVEKYYQGLGIDLTTMHKNGFSCTDFDFYLTDDSNEQQKYHISAFWKESEIEKGHAYFNKWKAYINEKSEQVITEV